MWTLLLTVGLKAVEYAMLKGAQNAELQKIFWKFVEKVKKNTSADLQNDAERQEREIAEKLKNGG